jgi:hypothetical protein
MTNKNNLKLFSDEEIPEKWRKDWKGMPEFNQEDLKPYQQIIISFECDDDVKKFAELIDQKLTYKTKSIWFPSQERESLNDYVYETE